MKRKKELVDDLHAKNPEINKKQIDSVLDTLVKTIHTKVKKGEKVAINKLGTFTKSRHKKRVGINPSTGEKMMIKAKHHPKFKPAKAFKDKL